MQKDTGKFNLGVGGGGVTPRWTTILDKINGKPRPPSPQIKDGKMARFGFCATSSLIWGDGCLLFHFISSKIVAYRPGGGRGGVEIFLVA